MNKKTLLFLAMTTPLLIMGAGCATSATSNQKNLDDKTPAPVSVAVATTDNYTNDDLVISGAVESGLTSVSVNSQLITTTTQNYVVALDIYGKNGARFQLSNCSVKPQSLNIKLGTRFMIDNQDTKGHRINVGTRTYQFGAHDFAIISIQKAGSFNITCDGAGVALVEVENL